MTMESFDIFGFEIRNIFDTRTFLCTGIAFICIYLFYKWATKNNEYFKKSRIPYLKPAFLFGNTIGVYYGKYSISDIGNHFYNSMPNARFFGLFDGRQPTLFLRDPEIIKKMMIKDFDHFEDHIPFIDEQSDKLFGNSLFVLKGRKWRDMRTILSPAFTGSRMRHMFSLISDCATQTINYFLSKDNIDMDFMNVDVKDIFSRYANDVIATCAYGIQVDSFQDRNNEFYKIGQLSSNFSGILPTIKFLIINIAPYLAKVLHIQLLDKKVTKFFYPMVLNNIAERERKGIFRPDMINILMQVKMGKIIQDENDANIMEDKEELKVISNPSDRKEWNDDEIVAQCFLFFIAGFDTISTMLTFTSYELAVNSEVQQKLYEEITKTHNDLQGKQLDYDTLQKMTYMDMVISETLRIWPPVPIIDRQCTKDYSLIKFGFISTFKQGYPVWIPAHAIHMDNKYFPNADKFDPERFHPDNRNNILSGTYLPFGVGPRNCIGSRFAIMEIKAILYNFLLNFSIEPCSETQIPLKIAKILIKVETEKPVKLAFKRRK